VTLGQSDVYGLLDAIRADGDIDIVRKGVELVLQMLIDAEATERIGAGRYERTPTRTTQRNGNRDRLLMTKAGDVELKIPKLRAGSFFPSILERRRRIDRALFAVVMEAYVHGVSTRKVDDLVAALGAASGISKSEVSRICSNLDTEMAAWRTRRLDHVEFPYLFADATYLKGRVNSQVVSRAVVVVTGVALTGEREVLGCAVGDTETEAFWAEFFRSLRARGLGGGRVKLLV
jgi:putative transposase